MQFLVGLPQAAQHCTWCLQQYDGPNRAETAHAPGPTAMLMFHVNLQSKEGTQLVRGILQLLEEWEYHFALAGVAHHSVKAMLAKNIDRPSRDLSRDMRDEGGKQQEQVRAFGRAAHTQQCRRKCYFTPQKCPLTLYSSGMIHVRSKVLFSLSPVGSIYLAHKK